MSGKRNLFDGDSDEEAENVDFTINKSYAQRYEEWREAEIKRKLEDQYGDADHSLSSSSSDDDDDPEELKQVLSKDFFEVISSLKTKDPKIYNPKVQFFQSEKEGLDPLERKKKIKKEKDKPIFLRDYERKLITERGGQLSDDESDMEDRTKAVRPQSPSYAEEQQQLKESLQRAVHDDSDEEGGLLLKKEKSEEEKEKEEEDYVAWLRGEKEDIQDNETKKALKPLQELWNDPKLDEGEKFLRDYVLNKRFLEKDNEPLDEGNLTDEEFQEEYMTNFERKFNFRFEEPDKDFLKRYPRTIENSMRKKDTRRAQHREAVKERKEEEKKRKKEELKVLKALKRKEILKKIEKIKEITGNDQLGLEPEELEEDFDPEAHDRRMKEMFSDDYYQGAEDEVELDELNLPPLDEELFDDYENWDEWDGAHQNDVEGGEENENPSTGPHEAKVEPHCEDPDFNMDCDYDPTAEGPSTSRSSAREKRKMKRQSRFGRLVRREKPVFDPNDKTFQEYVDEYYGMDYEDLIGDIPCRFKYKNVPANDFGLTIEEILAADDKELNQWASIKKTYSMRPEYVEKYEQKVYQQKARDLDLKKKLLPSLFKHENESNDQPTKKKKKKSKKVKDKDEEDDNMGTDHGSSPQNIDNNLPSSLENAKKKKKKNNTEMQFIDFSGHELARLEDSNKVVEGLEDDGDSKGMNSRLASRKKRKKSKNTPSVESVVEEGVIKGKRKKMGNAEDNAADGIGAEMTEKKKRKRGGDEEQHDLNGMDGSTEVRSVQVSKKRKGNKAQILTDGVSTQQENTESDQQMFLGQASGTKKHGSKKKNSGPQDSKQRRKKSWTNNGNEGPSNLQTDISDARLKAYGIHPKKFKNKLKYGNKVN